MGVDVRQFEPVSSVDTCAVWNILSSRTLSLAAARRNRNFVLVDYVRYECLDRPRSAASTVDLALMELLRGKLRRGEIGSVALSVDDLREVLRIESIRRLGRGEIAAMALARKMRVGFLTDDRAALRLAREAIPSTAAQTTPQLVGWLVFVGELGDSEVVVLIDEHDRAMGRSSLARYFQQTYETALQFRLAQHIAGQSSQ